MLLSLWLWHERVKSVGLAVVTLAALWSGLPSLDVTSTGWIVASVSGWTDLALPDGSREVNKKLEDDRQEWRRIPTMPCLCPVSEELFSISGWEFDVYLRFVEIKAGLNTPHKSLWRVLTSFSFYQQFLWGSLNLMHFTDFKIHLVN